MAAGGRAAAVGGSRVLAPRAAMKGRADDYGGPTEIGANEGARG